ncbi:MAG: toxin-antitoxin system YwqK family antitoxin [Bacteroidia bacterium]
MRRLYLLTSLLMFVVYTNGQEIKTYYENGNLKTSVPVNSDGLFSGEGFTFYQSGEMAMKTFYNQGKRQGTEREYYPDGMILGECTYVNDKREGWYTGYYQNGRPKFKQAWESDKKSGPMWVYHDSGGLRMFAMMQADTMVFAQHFNEEGSLQNEIVKEFGRPIDTTHLGQPVIEFANESEVLRSDFFNPVRVYIPGLPSPYLSFFSPHGKIIENGDAKYPLAFIPRKGETQFVLYLRIKTHPEALPIKLQSMILEVD